MLRYGWLLLSCCLVAGHLRADTIDYTITDLTATFMGGGPLARGTGSGSSAFGDPFRLDISYGASFPGGLITPGEPVNPGGVGFRLDCSGLPNCMNGGLASVGGQQFSVILSPGSGAISTTDGLVTFRPSTLTYVVPAMATGEFTAVCSLNLNCASGTVIGNVFVNLSGNLTFQFQTVGPGEYQFQTATFALAPVPEPAGVGLILAGCGVMSGVLLRRRKTVSA